MTLGVAARFLVFGDIGLLKVGASTQQEQLEIVIGARTLAELCGGARPLAEGVRFLGFGGIEIPAGSKAGDEEKISQVAGAAAVVGVEVVVLKRRSSEILIAVPGHGRARARGDVEHATEAVAVFGREASGH